MFWLTLLTKRIGIGHTAWARKERHANTLKVGRRHGRTQADKREHPFTVRVAWPYLSPSHSEEYVSVAMEG